MAAVVWAMSAAQVATATEASPAVIVVIVRAATVTVTTEAETGSNAPMVGAGVAALGSVQDLADHAPHLLKRACQEKS
jgi:hypothetical protein